MSLIGSLEDLGLGDILQIISLSQKSGCLTIRSDEGEGSIILHAGLVRGASLKGGPTDLRGLLVDGKFLTAADFDAARDDARHRGVPLEEAIAASTPLSAERIDALRNECVEAAVMAMFGWATGEFSFDVQSELQHGDEELLLPTGINAQYLAMEGSRIEDETTHARETSAERAPEEELSAHEMFGVPSPDDTQAIEPVAPPAAEPPLASFETAPPPAVPEAADPIEVLGLATAERVDRVEGAEDSPPAEIVAEPLERAPDVAVAAPPAVDRPPGAAPSGPLPPLVVIDPDLVALEWIKRSLKDSFARVHIFQRWDLGLNPIRQYLARMVRPVVLLHVDAPGDSLSGIRNPTDFVSRLRMQQPQIQIVLMKDHGSTSRVELGDADDVVARPGARLLRDPRRAAQLDAIAADLRAHFAARARAVTPVSTGRRRQSAASEEELGRLKAVTERLTDASNRGEVLPLVIRFASGIFDRVALFMIRGDTALGIAQHGLRRAGGPDDDAFRTLQMRSDGSAWFKAVLERHAAVRAAPSGGGDYTLAARIGEVAAEEAYLAPIESGGEVVAILYADNVPTRRPLGDAQSLEVVLHHAGLALERAMLERALAEA